MWRFIGVAVAWMIAAVTIAATGGNTALAWLCVGLGSVFSVLALVAYRREQKAKARQLALLLAAQERSRKAAEDRDRPFREMQRIANEFHRVIRQNKPPDEDWLTELRRKNPGVPDSILMRMPPPKDE